MRSLVQYTPLLDHHDPVRVHHGGQPMGDGDDGLIPAGVSVVLKTTSKFLMVSALAAIGLNTSIVEFKKAGLAPMFYGITIDTLVTLTALVVIWCMGV